MVFDCFTFFNELDLLEVRLNILDSVVDRFVLVEATVTQLGNLKPLYFRENKQRFAKFSDKIIHIVADNPPVLTPDRANKYNDNWLIENWQRSQIRRGLANCTSEDVIIVSDLDEIPRPEFVTRFQESDGVTCFEMDNYYFYLNFMSTIPPYRSIKMAKYKYYVDVLPILPFPKDREFCVLPEFREAADPNMLRQAIPDRIVKHGAWHFSFLGGAERVLKKRAALLEQNFYKGVPNDVEWVKRRLYEGLDPIGQDKIYYPTFAPWRLPRYVKDNESKYPELYYRAPRLHCVKLQMRYVIFRILAAGACVVRKMFGHVKIIKVIKRMLLK